MNRLSFSPPTASLVSTMAKPRIKPVQAAIARMSSGHGAQRLPPSLRAIEVRNIPSKGEEAAHRWFLKSVLPRIKYINNHVDVVMHWAEPRQSVKKAEGDVAEASSAPRTTSAPAAPPLVRVHFGGWSR